MKKQTAVSLIAENFNLLSDKDFKSWFLNSIDYLTNLECQQIIDIDHRLSVIEDYAKGEAADEITKLRKYITQTFTEPKND